MRPSLSAAQLDVLLKKKGAIKEPDPVALNHSATVCVGIQPSNLNRVDTNRRAYYEALPFTTVHGLQFKERSLSRVSRALPLLTCAVALGTTTVVAVCTAGVIV